MTDVQSAVAASNALTARWAAVPEHGRSTVLSGAGLWPLLAYLAAAADEPGRTELAGAVGLPADGAEVAAGALLGALRSTAAVRAALGIWARSDVAFTEWWAHAVPPGTRGELTGAPATDQAALDSWASRETDGLIPTMPVEVDEQTLMVLATALMVRTTWRMPFEDGPSTVTTGPWRGRTIAALSRSSAGLDPVTVASTEAGPLTIMRIEGDGDVDVHLVLGSEGQPGSTVLTHGVRAISDPPDPLYGNALLPAPVGPGLTVAEASATDGLPRLMIRAPRFTVEGSHDLIEHADVFGLGTVSDASVGRFPKMSATPLAVQQARQVAAATFSAQGFVAAAITAFAMQRAAAMPRSTVPMIVVTFDRPFGFVAVHRPTGLILVAGWVAEPEPWDRT